MLAGLPGIGVGTLFYVLIAFAMPFIELVFLVRGKSSAARWRQVGRQLVFASSIVLSIMIAERVLLYLLGAAGPESLSPARLLSHTVSAAAPTSIFATPVIISLMLLAAVLSTIEIVRLVNVGRSSRPATQVTRPAAVDRRLGEPRPGLHEHVDVSQAFELVDR